MFRIKASNNKKQKTNNIQCLKKQNPNSIYKRICLIIESLEFEIYLYFGACFL